MGASWVTNFGGDFVKTGRRAMLGPSFGRPGVVQGHEKRIVPLWAHAAKMARPKRRMQPEQFRANNKDSGGIFWVVNTAPVGDLLNSMPLLMAT